MPCFCISKSMLVPFAIQMFSCFCKQKHATPYTCLPLTPACLAAGRQGLLLHLRDDDVDVVEGVRGDGDAEPTHDEYDPEIDPGQRAEDQLAPWET